MFTHSLLGESPPPQPRACFGRDELIESVVGLAENLNPVGLIGAGGIGKTSIALTVLHHGRVKERFGNNRRFIRCDQFTASRANFLNQLSKVVGAGIKNAEDLTALRPALSSKEMLIVLDNAESILDPQLADGQEIYRVVEELSQFSNICLLVTSRITTIPPSCETFDVPTLQIEAARDTFYRIYKRGGRSDAIDDILKPLDFHPLSITLLATVAHQNKWDDSRLTKEWKQRHTGVLRTDHNQSLAATIELSLSSPMFVGLGPDARELLGVIAFFPQGINEDNVDWLFPTIPNVANLLDKLCMLSLTYRSDGFVTMLVPLRDSLCPKDPLSSPLFFLPKESYFTRLSAKSDVFSPGPKETQWIVSEDANVEHLLNVLTTIDQTSGGVWRACASFLDLLSWRKPRQTTLGPKVKQLPDDNPFKSECLFSLARLLDGIGNFTEEKRLLDHALKLERERGNDYRVALTLTRLSEASMLCDLYKEGMDQVKEALEIFERIGDIEKQGYSLAVIAGALIGEGQLDAAEEIASRAIQLLAEQGEYSVCLSHFALGAIYRSKGESKKAFHHFETILEIAPRFDWNDQSFWAHFFLAILFHDEGKADDALVHIEQANSHLANNVYLMGRGAELHACIYYGQHRFEDARLEALRAVEIFEKLGALDDLERCRPILTEIEKAVKDQNTQVVST